MFLVFIGWSTANVLEDLHLYAEAAHSSFIFSFIMHRTEADVTLLQSC